MLLMWQALAFTACVLIGLLPSTEVQCQFDVPLAEISPAPSPVSVSKPAELPAADPRPVVTSADQSLPASGTVEPQHDRIAERRPRLTASGERGIALSGAPAPQDRATR